MKKHMGAHRAATAFLISCLLAPQMLWAESAIDESPNEWAMVGDLVVARPLGAVMTVGGAAVWLVSLPFTLLAGHAGEAADKLIIGPGAATFARCLGCRNTGYTYKDVELVREASEGDEAEAAQ
ncbi:hypothetical protein [Haliea sp. E17]|uniref:hypothetical protein n=1 Tax=Haliea sp. E17 TaxID=3401576 RepID=UPI003AACA52A